MCARPSLIIVRWSQRETRTLVTTVIMAVTCTMTRIPHPAEVLTTWQLLGCHDQPPSRRLERLQLSVARAVMHQRRHPSMSKSQLLKQLGWPTLAWRRRRAKLIYFWKLVNNQGPPCLSSRIPKSVNNRCEYSLRNTGTVELPACSSFLYLSSFIPSSCLLWNSLPPDVSSCSSVSSFTLMLDSIPFFF